MVAKSYDVHKQKSWYRDCTDLRMNEHGVLLGIFLKTRKKGKELKTNRQPKATVMAQGPRPRAYRTAVRRSKSYY